MPAFKIYKSESAQISRWILAVAGEALIIFGCWSLFHTLPESWRGPMVSGFMPFGDEFPISWSLVISVVLWGLGSFGLWWLANFPRLIDFLAETEIEMTKVSWSSRKEVVGSSIVVMVTVVVLALWIGLVDVLLDQGPRWIRRVWGAIFGSGDSA